MSRSFRPYDSSDADDRLYRRPSIDPTSPGADTSSRRPSIALPPLASLDLGLGRCDGERCPQMLRKHEFDRLICCHRAGAAPRASSSAHPNLASYSINPRPSVSLGSGSNSASLPPAPYGGSSYTSPTYARRTSSTLAGQPAPPTMAASRPPGPPRLPFGPEASSSQPRPSGLTGPQSGYARGPTSRSSSLASTSAAPPADYGRLPPAPYATLAPSAASTSRPDLTRTQSSSSIGHFSEDKRALGPDPESAEEMRRVIENRKYRECKSSVVFPGWPALTRSVLRADECAILQSSCV